ncbi:hypothetical protein VM1G_02343 [Cytospora mali]|uniref:Rhodopsin domain-containing protein n=1 Tax=Cytospora mali TaxID=578113 RepID=A0A194VQL9_CYTMA|nr:hypothetical protein VM1G_02343 [Valsa mali]
MDLSQIPVMAPPPGVVSNFVNPVSLAPMCLAVITVTLSLMILFVALRFYARLRMSHAMGADDILCLISAALVITFCAITLSTLNNPLGPHEWDIPVSKITPLFSELSIVSLMIYAVSCMAVKSTLLVFYLRVFAPDPRAKAMVWLGLSFNIVFYTISIIVALVACVPHNDDGGWMSSASSRRCTTENQKFTEVQGVFGALTDLYVLLVPMALLARLHLSRKRKIGVYGVFLTGFVACAVSIINAVFRFTMAKETDTLWNTVPIYALSVSELNFGIICACMPVVFVLFKGAAVETASWVAKLRSWSSRSRNKTDIEMQPCTEEGKVLLPSVPRGTLTGLRSFMRGAGRSRPADTQVSSKEVSHEEVLTYVSADYDYHTQLRQPNPPSTDSSSRKQQLLRTYGQVEEAQVLFNGQVVG